MLLEVNFIRDDERRTAYVDAEIRVRPDFTVSLFVEPYIFSYIQKVFAEAFIYSIVQTGESEPDVLRVLDDDGDYIDASSVLFDELTPVKVTTLPQFKNEIENDSRRIVRRNRCDPSSKSARSSF